MPEIENIELRSEEVQEILGHIPSRIIRYGIVTITAIVLVVFIGSFFFKYPDIIEAPFELLTENPPADVSAVTSGDLSQIFVSDSQYVEQGQKLAIIKNSANLNHMVFLASGLSHIKQNMLNPDLYTSLSDTLQLGDVQNTYSAFRKATQEYSQFATLNYYPKKLSALSTKQNELSKYLSLMDMQASLKAKEYELAESQFKRDSQLFAKEVISLSDLEDTKRALIQEGMAVQTAQSTVINTRMQLQDIDQQIVEYEMEAVEQQNKHEQNLMELFHALESRIAWWFEQFVLLSPVSGTVAFNKIWNNNQYVVAGSQVFTVIPSGEYELIGRVTLTSNGAGKVKIGQTVNLKFNNFPYQEFGMVQAKVTSMSMVPLNNEYVLELNLPDTLVTNYGTILPFTQKMPGTAEIITEDLPLIARLFNPLKAVFQKHWKE